MADISKLSAPIDLPKSFDLKKGQKVTDEKLREVSDMYEKHFIKEMMKQMKATLPEGTLIKKNNAESIFEDQLDDQYAGEWNKRGGFGISDIIFEQLSKNFGDAKEAGLQKPHGPIEFKQDSKMIQVPHKTENIFRIQPLEKSKNGIVPASDQNTIEVKSPWAGTLQNKNSMEDDKTSFRIKHDNGLESLILIHGAATAQTRHLSPGDEIQAGEALGQASATSPLFWTVKKSVS